MILLPNGDFVPVLELIEGLLMSLEFYLRVESRPLLTEAPVHSQIDEGERTPAHLVGLILLNLIGTEYLHISPKPTLIILQIILDGVGL